MDVQPTPAHAPGRAKRAPGFAELVTRGYDADRLAREQIGSRHVVWALYRGGMHWRGPHGERLTSTERNVLVSLSLWLSAADIARGRTRVGATNERIAADLDLSPRMVQACLRSLEDGGWLVRVYTGTNRRYGAGGVDLAPLLARLDELEAAHDALEEAWRARGEETPETRSAAPRPRSSSTAGAGEAGRQLAQPRPAVDDSGADGDGCDWLGPEWVPDISPRDATHSAVTEVQPPVLASAVEARQDGVARAGVTSRPGAPGPASASKGGGTAGSSGPRSRRRGSSGPSGPKVAPLGSPGSYFAPDTPARPPATSAGVNVMLRPLVPEIAEMVPDPADWAGLVRLMGYLARDLGLPEPVWQRALLDPGPVTAVAVVAVCRARKARGDVANPVGWMRSLLEGGRAADIWRSVYALRRSLN